jgi:LysM repeat protein
MSKWPACWRIILILLAGVFWSGCAPGGDSQIDEEKDPNFIEGRNQQNARDDKGAIDAFERAVQANPRNAAAHFELALLYEKMGDFVSAIYHYQKHLQLRPKSDRIGVITPRIVACKMELAKTVTFGVVTREVHRDLERMTNELALMKQQNDALRMQLAAKPMMITQWQTLRVTNFVNVPQRVVVTNETSAPAPTVTNVARASSGAQRSSPTVLQSRVTPLPAAKRTYVVKSGETMSQIARKYNVPLAKLQAANPTIEARRLRGGQTLNIP